MESVSWTDSGPDLQGKVDGWTGQQIPFMKVYYIHRMFYIPVDVQNPKSFGRLLYMGAW